MTSSQLFILSVAFWLAVILSLVSFMLVNDFDYLQRRVVAIEQKIATTPEP